MSGKPFVWDSRNILTLVLSLKEKKMTAANLYIVYEKQMISIMISLQYQEKLPFLIKLVTPLYFSKTFTNMEKE